MWKSEDIWEIVEDKKAAYGKEIHKLSKYGGSLKKCDHNTKIQQEWKKYYQRLSTEDGADFTLNCRNQHLLPI